MKRILNPKKKAIIALRAKIRKSNHLFKKAKPAQRRVMIAKDILKWLDTPLIEPARRTGYLVTEVNLCHSDPKEKVDNVLIDIAGDCTVCAKGAFFVATAMRMDALTMKSFDGDLDDPQAHRTYMERMGVMSRGINGSVLWNYLEREFESGEHATSREAMLVVCFAMIDGKGNPQTPDFLRAREKARNFSEGKKPSVL